MAISLKMAMGIAGLVVATQAAAQVTLYSRDDFRGQQFTTAGNVRDLDGAGFNDTAQSAVVERGSWQACEDAGYGGRCVVLRPGQYRSLADMGLKNEISSVRAVDDRLGYDDRGGARLAQGYDYRRRADERLFDVPVTSVHAVVGPPEQRCWVERQRDRRRQRGKRAGRHRRCGDRRYPGPSDRRRSRTRRDNGRRRGRRCGDRVQRRPRWRRRLQPRCSALCDLLARPTPRLLGCNVRVPRSAASRADECAARADDHRQRGWRAADLSRTADTRGTRPGGPSGPLFFARRAPYRVRARDGMAVVTCRCSSDRRRLPA